MPLRYGFDSQGGFIVVDDARRMAAYAYSSSPHERRARRDPEATAARMLPADEPASRFDEDMYQRLTSALYMASIHGGHSL